jgi:signal transduction histidine kinase
LLAAALIGLIWAVIERRRINFKNLELAPARFDLANQAERERKRIAQDLHDQTLADLRTLMLKSDEIPTDDKSFRREIEAVSTEMWRICEGLSPSVLVNVGLIPALEFLLGQTISNYQFRAAENLDEKLNFSASVQMQIYRITQEILTNIKHRSDAVFVQMKINISPENELILMIEDDGTFFNPQQISSKGRGIANIKSRAALIEADILWRKGETKGRIFELKKLT